MEYPRSEFDICDQTQVNETNVVNWPKWDFDENICYMSLELIWHQNYS